MKLIAEPGKQEITITREFNAPRELVFKAYTDPKLISQWLGPKNLTMEVEQYDAKSGGSYRYVNKDDKGNSYSFRGVIHEVVAPVRIIQTFEYEGLPEKGHVSMDTVTFKELAEGKTLLTIHSIFMSVADRDGMVMSGMERGVKDSMDKLEELLKQA